jgi:hypothetical protein
MRAAFLHMHPEKVLTRGERGLIPGAKTGRCWIFLEIDLAEFVRSLYPVRRQGLQVTSQVAVCHSESAGRSGGSTSLPPVVSEYDGLDRAENHDALDRDNLARRLPLLTRAGSR